VGTSPTAALAAAGTAAPITLAALADSQDTACACAGGQGPASQGQLLDS
jgi:hypothetical protein